MNLPTIENRFSPLQYNLRAGEKDYIAIAKQFVLEKYPVIYQLDDCDDPLFRDEILNIVPIGTILGGWAYSAMGVARFILNPSAQLDLGVLPGDVVRRWLEDEFGLPFKRNKLQLGERFYPAPHLAKPGMWGDCSYVDISSTYTHFLQLGYDLEYRRGKYLGSEVRPIPTQIKAHKDCYSLAVTMSHNVLSKINIKKNEQCQIYTRQPYNKYSNPCLYNLANDTLNAIASEIIRVLGDKVVYYNTDGCIVDSEYARFAQDILTSWGFSSKIKAQGDTIVWGVGRYSIGTGKHAYRAGKQGGYSMYHQNELMEKSDCLWLKARMQKKFHQMLSADKGDFLL